MIGIPSISIGGADSADASISHATPTEGNAFADALSRAFDSAGDALAKADRSEHAFAHGTGGLQEMVLDRAQADIALSVATTAASRATQALSTILGMQV